jgi:ADP-heptose:LPS heptosyltransferase
VAVLVKQEGLGDSCLRLPFLRSIARRFPDRPIWWISDRLTAMATSMAPYVTGLIAEVRPNFGICGPRREIEPRLRSLPAFSFVFDLRTGVADVWHARQFLSYQTFICCLPGYFLSARRPPGRFFRPRHSGLRALSLAAAVADSPVEVDHRLAPSPSAAAAARAVLPAGQTYVGLAIGSGESFKNWPPERFAVLARELHERGIRSVLLKGFQDSQYADAISRMVPDVIDPGGLTEPIDGIVAVAERLALVVANDCGIAHVCAAAGRPIVSLFGPTDPRRWAPWSPVSRIIRAQEFGGSRMDLIPVEAVLRAVNEQLAIAETREPASANS